MDKETLTALDNLLTYFAREIGVKDHDELYPDFQKVNGWYKEHVKRKTLFGFISTTEESDLAHYCLRFYPETAEQSLHSLEILGKTLVPATLIHEARGSHKK